MTSPWQHIPSMRIISQNGVSDTHTQLSMRHTHPLLRKVKIMPNLHATALRATKWSGFILKVR